MGCLERVSAQRGWRKVLAGCCCAGQRSRKRQGRRRRTATPVTPMRGSSSSGAGEVGIPDSFEPTALGAGSKRGFLRGRLVRAGRQVRGESHRFVSGRGQRRSRGARPRGRRLLHSHPLQCNYLMSPSERISGRERRSRPNHSWSSLRGLSLPLPRANGGSSAREWRSVLRAGSSAWRPCLPGSGPPSRQLPRALRSSHRRCLCRR